MPPVTQVETDKEDQAEDKEAQRVNETERTPERTEGA